MKTILIFIILFLFFRDTMNNPWWISILLTTAFLIDIIFLNKQKQNGKNI